MADPLAQYSAAWVLDLYESHATVYAASTDLYTAAGIATLGTAYPKLIKNAEAIRLTESYSDDWYGIAAPVRVTVVLDNSLSDLSTAYEWRNVRCRLRRYDWIADEARTELTGVVIDASFAGTEATLTLSDQPTDVLSTLIPRKLVNVDDFTMPSITGVAFWTANTPYALRATVRPTLANDYYYVCTTAGTSHATDEPDWPLTAGETKADGTVTWTTYDSWSYGPSDLGAAIPVVFGTADVNCPLVGEDGDSDPGGQDFLVCPLVDRDGATMSVTIESVYSDSDSTSPGLENALDWMIAPGSPSRVSNTTFTVTGFAGLSAIYAAQAPLRCYVGGGTTYVYTEVVSFAATSSIGGTVTVKSAVLTGTITDMDIGTTLITERSRYSYTIAGTPPTTVNYLSLRLPDGAPAGIVARVANSSITNPARVIQEILSYDATSGWGLGETCDTTTFDAAATALTTAGITVGGSIGGDRRQRTAREVLRELLSLRGMRLKQDGQNSEWTLAVDAAAASSLTLGLGVGTPNNIKAVRSHTKTPLDQATSRLVLRYGTLGRLKVQEGYTISSLIPTDYKWSVSKSVAAVGKETTITSPWLQNFTPAVRTAYYLGARLDYGDEQVDVVCGMEARDVAVGATVSVLVPHDGIGTDANADGTIDTAATFTVTKVERSLNETVLGLRGYDAAIFETNITTIKAACVYGPETEAEIDDVSETSASRGGSANLLVNGDFSVGLRATLAEDGVTVPTNTILPGWLLSYSSGLQSIVIHENAAAIGGRYVTLQSSNSGASPVLQPAASLSDWAVQKINVTAGQVVMFSIYAPTTNPGWGADPYHVSNATPPFVTILYPTMRANPADKDGIGGIRYWFAMRAPTDGYIVFKLQINGFAHLQEQWTFGAAMAEIATPGQLRPSPWKRHPTWGVKPAALQPGDVNVRPTEETTGALGGREVSAGMTYGHTWGTDGASPAAGSTTIAFAASGGTPVTQRILGAIPHGVRVEGVTVRVLTSDSSGLFFDVGYDNDLDAWGANIPASAGEQTGIEDFTVLAPINFLGDGPHDVVLTMTAVPTGDGTIKLLVHWTKLTAPPTS